MALTKIQSLGITDGTIVNADINASAAIAGTKLTGVGKVLQVVTATDSTNRTTTSTSFVTASNTLSVSITPSSASNKVFVSVSSTICNGSGDGFIFATIYRGATNLGESTNGMAVGNSVPGITGMHAPLCMTILDSPSSTSALTYQVYFRSNNASYIANLQAQSTYVIKGSITAFEIAG
jgi:hypothetical protein